MDDFSYQCVLCAGKLQLNDAEEFSCGVCGAAYPVIDGVNVFVLNPTGLLLVQRDQVADDPFLAKWHDLKLKLERENASPESLSKLEGAFGVWLANLKVFRDRFAPAEEYLALHRGREGALALFTSYPHGWPLDRSVPYFYRDWSGAEEGSSVARLFREAIPRYSRVENKRVAVLGCGACGLLYQLSDQFERSFGLDISVPNLLLAKHLLEGGETAMGFNFPNDLFPQQQRRIQVGGGEKRPGISLSAANVNNMPFPSDSVSCVITQYLFDLMNDQAALAAEIHRVLVPDGLWINFGLPSCQSAIDLATHLDLPSFLEWNGFDACEVANHRSSQLELTGISELARAITQTHVFFVARKSRCERQHAAKFFTEYFSGHEAPLLEKAPTLSDRFVFSIGQEKRFSQGSIERGHVLEVRSVSTGWQAFNSPLRTPISESGAQFLELLLSAMDGTRTVADLMNLIQEKVGSVTNREIALFLRALYDSDFCRFG